jgi:hypothetical protein
MTDTRIETRIDDVYDLGEWIGRRQAMATLAGACSAADAECLRQVRDGRKYRALGMTWEQFCHKRVGIDRVTAERIIRRLEEFGPRYFTMAQITGISPAEYRRLTPLIGEQGLARDGQTVAITQENAPRLIEAVQELRRTTLAASKPRPEPEPEQTTAPEPGAQDSESALTRGGQMLAQAVNELERARALGLSLDQTVRLRALVVRELSRLSVVQLINVTLPGR